MREQVLLLCVWTVMLGSAFTASTPYPPGACSDTENQELLEENPYVSRNNTETSSTYVMKYYDIRNSFRHEVGEVKNYGKPDSYMEVHGYLIWWTTFKKDGEDRHKVLTMHYLVDNKGYHVEGDHIPGTKDKVPNKLVVEKVPCKEAAPLVKPQGPAFTLSLEDEARRIP